MLVRLILFLIVTIGITIFSWPSLKDSRSHGFYRYFAFESTLVLFLLNVEHWFVEPFTIPHIISWLLLAASLILVIHGFWLLRVIGKPQGKIENTTTLVKIGMYKYIRHPLYSSILFLAWGIFLKDPSVIGIILAMAATVFLFATAKVEEAENLAKFGADYSTYIKSTRMFIPFVF